MLRNFLKRLHGRTPLLSYEQLCIDAWCKKLSPAGRAVLKKQLAQADIVQRQAGGAKLCFYYREKNDVPSFKNIKPDQHVATIWLADPADIEKKSMRVNVFLHRGRFFSLEFPKRPRRFADQHEMRLEDVQVNRVELLADID